MTDIAAIQAEIIDEFSLFDDWQERYRHIIDLGKNLPPFPERYRDDEHLVRGCQSRVWLHPYTENGLLHFHAASDAVIVSGLVALLLRVFSGHSPAAIVAAEPSFIAAIGLSDHLSPNRSNGLHAMIRTMKAIAAGQRAEQS